MLRAVERIVPVFESASYRTIGVTVSDGIATLVLNRPDKLNAVDDVMHSELSTVFAAANDDARVRAVVLTGAGRAFSAGGDQSCGPVIRHLDGTHAH
jgi:enoyl-CoA hydratase